MPVRDVEWWTPPRTAPTYSNRGVNGIDGVVSTALGVAVGARALGLVGDITMLHDVSALVDGLGRRGRNLRARRRRQSRGRDLLLSLPARCRRSRPLRAALRHAPTARPRGGRHGVWTRGLYRRDDARSCARHWTRPWTTRSDGDRGRRALARRERATPRRVEREGDEHSRRRSMIATLPSSLLAALPIAVAAGFVSFISPCVLPAAAGLPRVPQWRRRVARRSYRAADAPCRCGRVHRRIRRRRSSASAHSSADFGASLKDHERVLSIVFGSVTILLGMFFAGWWPSRFLNRERRIHSLAAGFDPRRGRAGIPVRAGMDALSRSDARRDPGTRGHFGCDGAARIDPHVLLLPRSRHPVHRRGAGDRVGVDRVIVVAPPPTRHRSNRWRAAHRHRRARGDGRVALVRHLVASALPVVSGTFLVRRPRRLDR